MEEVLYVLTYSEYLSSHFSDKPIAHNYILGYLLFPQLILQIDFSIYRVIFEGFVLLYDWFNAP